MSASKVYFTSFRTSPDQSPLEKLDTLLTKAGMKQMPLEDKFTAIKLHFGEPGNVSFVRPNYARVVVDALKGMGARPFLTDCNTLYPGMRRNALDHIEAAYQNGFSPMQVGCQVIIADGLVGNDHVSVPIQGEYLDHALIGRAVMDADAVISLTHFKAHELTGIGGALKNIGMGLGSTAGKREMHNDGKPTVDAEACVGCGMCVKQCGQGAISFHGEGKSRKAFIDHEKCAGCGRCVGACRKQGAIGGIESGPDLCACKISEYALAVLQGRPHFHISLVMDVSPLCDCHSGNDLPIVPNVGMFASFDPVALDTACAEACNKMPAIPGSWLDEVEHKTGDHFHDIGPSTNWRAGLEHAQKLGLGTMEYEIIEV